MTDEITPPASPKKAIRTRTPKNAGTSSIEDTAGKAPVESTETASPKKPAKASAKPRSRAAKTSTEQPELPVIAPTPSAPREEAPAPAPAVTPIVPIRVVGEDTPATKSANDSGSRHEAVEFDPGAILARFAPKPAQPAEPKASAEQPAADNAPSEKSATENRPAAEAGTWTDANSAEQSPENPGTEENRREDRRPGRHERDRNGQQPDRRHPNDRPNGQQQGRHPNDRQNGPQQGRHPNDRQQQQGRQQQGQQQGRQQHQRQQQGSVNRPWLSDADTAAEHELEMGAAFNYNSLNDEAVLAEQLALATAEDTGTPFEFNALYSSTMNEIVSTARNLGLKLHRTPQRRELVGLILDEAGKQKRPIRLTGTLELLEDGNGLLVYGFDNYKVRDLSAFVPRLLIKKHALLRGHEVEALALPARSGETAPMVVRVNTVMGLAPEVVMEFTPFTELTPYYPTKRILLETENGLGWDNLSMRCVDLLCPIGLGQRGLIVAPPRTGKTVLMQAMANAMTRNYPEAHLIVLLVDERPEEVTDFKRNTKANEVVSSTFDENAESHVHAAEMVIERARRMVECGRHVIILLDSITRLARAYNTMVPSTGKILSGGVEAGALTRPKRFFGSARNIEGGGSLTILGTALVDTGSKMDEVIFEEFKGTGNMELDLDRDLANKRIFPAINFEKSGTRKEELLYHPDEMAKVYGLRRAMKGVPSVEAMEMLIQRVKKSKTNAEFLMTLNR